MGVVIARTAVSTIWIARRLFMFFGCIQTHTQSTCFEARMMCSSPSSDVLYFILCRHTTVTSSGKTGELSSSVRIKSKHKHESKKPYGAHNESRFSVSLRKKDYQTVRHTQNPYRFSIWTGTRELNIMCASLYFTLLLYTVCCAYAWHITNGKMIFCLSASHTRQQSIFIRRSLFRNASICYSLWRLIDPWMYWWGNWFEEWRMIDSRSKRLMVWGYAKWCGERAVTESHCSDIKRE